MAAIDSIIEQPYKNWELCIADDCSTNPKIISLLKSFQKIYINIKVVFRPLNGHISASTNSALEIATGDYILFMDHDDLLTQNCLYEFAKHINRNPDVDIIYSDEDKINDAGIHVVPFFKPNWSPHNLLSRNYFGHAVVMKKQLADQLGGCRVGFEGSQDYDLILRAVECTDKIGHIPKVLYHWRIHSLSAAQSEEVKPYAYIAAKKAIYESIDRQGLSGEVKFLAGLRGYSVRFNLLSEGKVSIIIPSKDQAGLLENCLESIYNLTSYKNFEVIVINNNSISSDFFKLIKKYEGLHPDSFRSIDLNIPFNFAALMNKGVEASTGEYILLLNNDIEIIHTDWLYNMVAYAQLKNVGAVGAKLLYPDDTIQHAGVIIGLGGVAGHAFVNQHKDDPGYFNYIQSVSNYSAVTAACLMCRKEVFLEINGMEEELAVEYNDVDLCLKMIVKGYHNVYLPHVELYHFESVSRGHPHLSKESYERHIKEIGIFSKKWGKYIKNDPCYNPNLNLGVHDFSMNFSA
jgi:GT2 family glycosyltransferase